MAEEPTAEYGFTVGEAPMLEFPITDINGRIPAASAAWEVYLCLTPRTLRALAISGFAVLINPQECLWGFQIAGGRLPTEPLPTAPVPNSFDRAGVWDGVATCRIRASELDEGQVVGTTKFRVRVE